MSVSTIIPLSKTGKNILFETCITNSDKNEFSSVGINPTVIPSHFRLFQISFHNRLFRGIGCYNTNGGIEYYSPQLNDILRQEKEKFLSKKVVKEREMLLRNLKTMRLHPRKKALASLKETTEVLCDDTIIENGSSLFTITLSNPGTICFPKKEGKRTQACCLFVNFLDYLFYQTLLQTTDDLCIEDCDCLIMNNVYNFATLLLDSDYYERVYCVFPHNTFGKTMEMTLRSRRGECVVDMASLYKNDTNTETDCCNKIFTQIPVRYGEQM